MTGRPVPGAEEPLRTSFAERLYSRMGGWYLIVILGVVVVVFLIDIGVAVVGALEFGLPTSRLWPMTVLAGTGCLVAAAISFVVAHRLMRPIWNWIRGHRSPELAAEIWSAPTERLPAVILWGGLFFLVGVLPATLYMAAVSGLPWYGGMLLVGWVAILVAAATIADYLGAEAALRPVLRDVARYLPDNFTFPEFGRRLRPKLWGAVAVVVSFTAALAVGAGPLVDSLTARVAVAMAVAVAMTGTLALALSSLLARSIASPVEQLVVATRKVEQGNLDVRVPVTGWDEMGTLARSFNAMVRGLREREALRSAMGSYVHPEIARRVLEEGELLDGVETDATLLFMDVRDFTSVSEDMEAAEIVAYLNQLFSVAVPLVEQHGGHVNKFLGDGLLAVFGVPEGQPDHAERAVAAAREIVRQVQLDFRGGVRIGIGINSGPVVAGTIGGGTHLEFALIGDTVNLAARVEQLTKDGGDSILITDATRARLDGVPVRSRGMVPIRGKRDEVAVFAVSPAEDST